ncbi:MAG: hypothetical protein ACTSPI_16735 [Candidatus Heimdallarchaeaceae archaeon]
MPAISMNEIEILPALLDRSKTQTIRPLTKAKGIELLDTGTQIKHELLDGTIIPPENPEGYKKPRLKVGDLDVFPKIMGQVEIIDVFEWDR